MRPEPETPKNVPALYADEHLYIVNKPAGLPVHPVSSYVQGTVVGRLREQFGHGFAAPVHRLDRETSGVLLCARTRTMAKKMSHLFIQQKIYKKYLAICWGYPRQTSFDVDVPISDGGSVIRIASRVDFENGRPAHTSFFLRGTFMLSQKPMSVWEAVPHTGRKHQIRVHLRHAGYPIVGDKIYSAGEYLYENFCRQSMTEENRRMLCFERHALHASEIQFVHPYTGKVFLQKAPWPQDLSQYYAIK